MSNVLKYAKLELEAAKKAYASKGPFCEYIRSSFMWTWIRMYGMDYRKWLTDEDEDGDDCDCNYNGDLVEFNTHDLLLLAKEGTPFLDIMEELVKYRVTDDDTRDLVDALKILMNKKSL